MRYELIAVFAIITCLFILGIEYLWLYLLAGRQEDHIIKYEKASKKVTAMVDGILYCPTESARSDEINELVKFVSKDSRITEILCDQILGLMAINDDSLGEKQTTVEEIYSRIKPKEVFHKILGEGDFYNQGYACRKLADFNAVEYIEDIRKCLESKKRDLAYNAAMALSTMGDTESVANFILKVQDDRHYSYRVIMEIMAIFTGSKEDLAKKVLEGCNDYMKATVIKSIGPHKLKAFEEMYLEGTKSNNNALKIACVKAVGYLENEQNEHDLIIALGDKDWVVRSAAIKGLARLRTNSAIEAVKRGIKDPEWWVRQAAASALVNMDIDLSNIEDIMKGYDRYATDALKYSLYKTIDIKGEDD